MLTIKRGCISNIGSVELDSEERTYRKDMLSVVVDISHLLLNVTNDGVLHRSVYEYLREWILSHPEVEVEEGFCNELGMACFLKE